MAMKFKIGGPGVNLPAEYQVQVALLVSSMQDQRHVLQFIMFPS